MALSASRTERGAAVELHTSGPADFQVDRFTMGNWVNVWSPAFRLSADVDEIPLEFERPDLEDLVTGASLVQGKHHASIRVYLGPAADQRGVFHITDGDITTLQIPAREGLPAARTVPQPPDGSLDAISGSITGDSAVELRAGGIDPAADETEVRVTVIETDPDDRPVSAEGTEIIEPLAPARIAPVEPAGGGSFYIPRRSEVDEAPAAGDGTGSEKREPWPTQPNPAGASSITDSPTTVAEMNYQIMPVDPGSGTGTDNEEQAPALQRMMEAATQMATEMLGQTPAGETAADETAPAGPDAISTPPADFHDPFRSQAAVSRDGDAGSRELPAGKEALADIYIDLFEIVGSPLDQAITLLVAPTDYNIIVDSSVGANSVSLSFKEGRTDLKSALDMITRTYGLDYAVEANTIVVAAREQVEGQLVQYETRLFVLSYADPESVKEMLITTTLLREDQVEIYTGETAYPEVNDSTQLSTESGSEGTEIKPIQSNLSSTPRNAVLVKAVPEQMVKIAAVIAEIDRQPKLIELEVRVCEAGQNALQDLGIELNNNGSTPVPTFTVWTEQPSEKQVIEAWSAGSFHRSPLQFMLDLNTQIQDGNVEVLAQPTLSTVEGKQAIYFAGERIPYIAKVSQTQAGTQIEVDFLNVGITLSFKPRMDADGRLTIDVNPIVSSLLEFRMIGDLVEAPRTSSRQLATTVRVADMEPFVLAGLISETERETVTKIPLLGDMPLVGKLFRNKNLKGERSEIVVVVVPHVRK